MWLTIETFLNVEIKPPLKLQSFFFPHRVCLCVFVCVLCHSSPIFMGCLCVSPLQKTPIYRSCYRVGTYISPEDLQGGAELFPCLLPVFYGLIFAIILFLLLAVPTWSHSQNCRTMIKNSCCRSLLAFCTWTSPFRKHYLAARNIFSMLCWWHSPIFILESMFQSHKDDLQFPFEFGQN